VRARAVTEDPAEACEKPDTDAGGALHRERYKRYSRYTRPFWPVTAGGVGDGQQRLPHISGSIFDSFGHLRIDAFQAAGDLGSPRRQ